MTMNRKQLDRFRQSLALTAASESEEAFCDQTQQLLAVYVEQEMNGEAIEARYPAITRHLQVCPDCRAEYEALQSLLATEEPPIRPRKPLDMAQLPPRVAPNQLRAPDMNADSRVTWANKRIQAWLAGLAGLSPTTSLATRDPRGRENAGRQEAPYQIAVMSLGPDVRLQLIPLFEDGMAHLRAYFAPSSAALFEQLRGSMARLYQLKSDPEPQAVFIAESMLQAGGTIQFDDLPLGSYMLTLDRPAAGEIELAWLDAAKWQP